MVKSGEEESFKKEAEKIFLPQFPKSQFFSFQRKLKTNQGKYFDVPLFSGYVFFGIDKLSSEFFENLKKVPGFCRILYDNQNPVKISGSALEELMIFIHNGQYWDISKVEFLPGKKIKAISGPLVGLEGKIIAVNKKKGRVTVQSSLTEDSKKFDLLYEDVSVSDAN